MLFCLPKLLPFLRALWLNKALEPTTSCFSEPFVEKGPKSWSNIHGKKNPGWVIYLGALLKICLKKATNAPQEIRGKLPFSSMHWQWNASLFEKKKLRIKNWRIETSKKSYTAQPPVRLTAKVGDLGRFLPNWFLLEIIKNLKPSHPLRFKMLDQ